MTPTFTPPLPNSPDPQSVRRIQDLALQLIGTDRGRDKWLERPNPELGGASPNDLIAAGRGDLVENFIEANLNGDGG
jgi:uncharacterized protein (DUF2384 family)